VATVSFGKIWGAFNETRRHAGRSAQLCLVGDPADIEVLRRALVSRGDTARAAVDETDAAARTGAADDAATRDVDRSGEVLRTFSLDSFPRSAKELRGCSLVVFAARAGGVAPDALRAPVTLVREAQVPLLAVLLDGDSAQAGSWVASDVFFAQEVAVVRPGEALARSDVARSMASLAKDHAVPLAARLPGMRAAVVDRLIQTAARQNGIVGVVVFIPGADMPVMTANQIRMVLQIAAAYGEHVGFDRAIEILSVVGIGFGLRTVAREALDFIPGPGWMFKGGFGYTATVALGKAAARYFEDGAPLTTSRVRRLTEKLGKIPNPLSGRGSRTG
jgi:uncharacterized protein (DUF697 family)